MATHESKNSPTPASGVRSEIYYFDDNGNSVDKAKATIAVVRELDAAGNLLAETRARITA